MMCHGVGLLGSSCLEDSVLSELGCLFSSLGKFTTIISSNMFSVLFSLFSFWDPYNEKISKPNAVSEGTYMLLLLLLLLLLIFFSFYCSDWVITTIPSSISLIHSPVPSNLLLISSSVLFFSFQLLYSSVLIGSFLNCLSMLKFCVHPYLSILMIIILNSLSVRFVIFIPFSSFSGILFSSFIWNIFLCLMVWKSGFI